MFNGNGRLRTEARFIENVPIGSQNGGCRNLHGVSKLALLRQNGMTSAFSFQTLQSTHNTLMRVKMWMVSPGTFPNYALRGFAHWVDAQSLRMRSHVPLGSWPMRQKATPQVGRRE